MLRCEFYLLSIILISLFCKSCGSNKKSENQDTPPAIQKNSANQASTTIDVPIYLEEKPMALHLASAQSFSMSIGGCISGHTAKIQESSTTFKAYLGDQGCLVKLESFTTATGTWTMSSSDPFTDYLEGDVAIFEGSTSREVSLRVEVIHQLSSPIKKSDKVTYSFTQLSDRGTQPISQDILTKSHSLSVEGWGAPTLSINNISFLGLTEDGAGRFKFQMACNTPIQGSTADALCGEFQLQQINYVLVQDTYDGYLSLEDAQHIFASTTKRVNDKDVITVDTEGILNGGFNTKALAGPASMHDNPNMILIFSGLKKSFLYYNVDVSILSQP